MNIKETIEVLREIEDCISFVNDSYYVGANFHKSIKIKELIPPVIQLLTQIDNCKGLPEKDGTGIWYDCGYCKGIGKVNIFKRIYWEVIK